MKSKIILAVVGAGFSVVALAGCTAAATNSSSGATSSGSSSTSSTSASVLDTATTSLGSAITDGKGDTVYLFTNDKQNSGKSTCTGACASVWPAVTTKSEHPKVLGVTGKIGTISLADGSKQVTVNGWPLYTYSGDSAAGDLKGQGLMNAWFAVSPAGDSITTSSTPAPTSGSGTGQSSSGTSSSGSTSTGTSGSAGSGSSSAWG